MSIEINNYAISELSKGNYKTAYEALSYAVSACSSCSSHHHHHYYYYHQQNTHNISNHDQSIYSSYPTTTTGTGGRSNGDAPGTTSVPSTTATTMSPRMLCPYQYAWVDCTQVLQRTMAKDPKLNQGQYAPFLYMKFLLILPMSNHPDQQHQQQPHSVSSAAPCCYTWVLSYNLGVVTAILGRNIDKNGHDMLQQSLRLLDHVQHRVQLELCHQEQQQHQQQQSNTMTAISKHWSTLQLSIWNNQACVLSELAVGIMRDHERLDRLIQMGLTLSKVSAVLDVSDQDRFHWTVQVLMEDNFAPAA